MSSYRRLLAGIVRPGAPSPAKTTRHNEFCVVHSVTREGRGIPGGLERVAREVHSIWVGDVDAKREFEGGVSALLPSAVGLAKILLQ